MSIIRRMLRQSAVYWEITGHDEWGKPITEDPIEIKCRWEDVGQLFVNIDGDEVMSNARIYVDRDVKVGGRLRLGAFNTLVSQSWEENEDVFEVRRFEKLPDLKNRKVLRTAYV